MHLCSVTDIFLGQYLCHSVSCRRGSGPRTYQSGLPGAAAASCVSVLWTSKTASGRKPADASWQPNEPLLSDRTRPQRGQTASRSTSPKPRRDYEVCRFLLWPLRLQPAASTSTLIPVADALWVVSELHEAGKTFRRQRAALPSSIWVYTESSPVLLWLFQENTKCNFWTTCHQQRRSQVPAVLRPG